MKRATKLRIAAITGCSVHFVDGGVDSGPIIAQRAVPVLDDDSAETLHERIQQAEHVLYPECIEAIAHGRLRVEGRRVLWDKSPRPIRQTAQPR